MSDDVIQQQPAQRSLPLPACPAAAPASRSRRPPPDPDIVLESDGAPDVSLVVAAFRPLMRRLLDRK